MLYKPPSYKLAMEILNLFVNSDYKSFVQLDLVANDNYILLVSKLFDREPKDIARMFLEYRIRNYGTGVMA